MIAMREVMKNGLHSELPQIISDEIPFGGGKCAEPGVQTLTAKVLQAGSNQPLVTVPFGGGICAELV